MEHPCCAPAWNTHVAPLHGTLMLRPCMEHQIAGNAAHSRCAAGHRHDKRPERCKDAVDCDGLAPAVAKHRGAAEKGANHGAQLRTCSDASQLVQARSAGQCAPGLSARSAGQCAPGLSARSAGQCAPGLSARSAGQCAPGLSARSHRLHIHTGPTHPHLLRVHTSEIACPHRLRVHTGRTAHPQQIQTVSLACRNVSRTDRSDSTFRFHVRFVHPVTGPLVAPRHPGVHTASGPAAWRSAPRPPASTHGTHLEGAHNH
eukprot:358512-Chlamydomonas_euryale.AAC.1